MKVSKKIHFDTKVIGLEHLGTHLLEGGPGKLLLASAAETAWRGLCGLRRVLGVEASAAMHSDCH